MSGLTEKKCVFKRGGLLVGFFGSHAGCVMNESICFSSTPQVNSRQGYKEKAVCESVQLNYIID